MITGSDNWCRQVGEYHAAVTLLLECMDGNRDPRGVGMQIAVEQLREVHSQADKLMGLKSAS